MENVLRLRTALFSAALASACLLAPSLARAADLCVHDTACIQAGNAQYQTLDAALAAAEAGPSDDTIHIAPGTYSASTFAGFSAPLYPVHIFGAGAGSTVLTGGDPVMTLGNAASSVRGVSIVVPSGGVLPQTGLSLTGGIATRVSVSQSATSSPNTIGVKLQDGGYLADSTVAVHTDQVQTAVEAHDNGRVVNDVLTAAVGIKAIGPGVRVDRTRVTGTREGIWTTKLNTAITDSVFRVPGDAVGISAFDGGSSAVSLTVSGATIVGEGGNSRGVEALSNVGHPVTVVVDSSIIDRVGTSLHRASTGPAAAILGTLYSDFDPAKVSQTGLGVIGVGAGDMNVDPQFAGTDDFHLRPGSPMIDAGDPAALGDTADADSSERILGARRDIGAYEAPVPAPTDGSTPATGGPASPASPSDQTAPPAAAADSIAPSIAGLKMTPRRFTALKGSRLRFVLSEQATVTVTIKRKAAHGPRLTKVATVRRPLAAGAKRIAVRRRIGRARLRPGAYVAVVSAVDAAGNRSRSYRTKFRVVAR